MAFRMYLVIQGLGAVALMWRDGVRGVVSAAQDAKNAYIGSWWFLVAAALFLGVFFGSFAQRKAGAATP